MAKIATELLICGKRKAERYTYNIFLTGKWQELVFYFQPPNDIERSGVQPLLWPLYRRYVKGGWIDEEGNVHEQKDVLQDGDGQPIALNDGAIEMACRAQMCQAPPTGEADIYSAIECLRIMGVQGSPWPQIESDMMDHWQGKGWQKKIPERTTKPSTTP